jgi:hypothetical protein
METLATVDMSPAFAGEEGEKQVAEALRNAATTVGFLYLINHGVPSEVIKNAYEQLHKFFDLPLDVKMKVHTSLSAGVRGYIGIYEQVCLSCDALPRLLSRCVPTAGFILRETTVWTSQTDAMQLPVCCLVILQQP